MGGTEPTPLAAGRLGTWTRLPLADTAVLGLSYYVGATLGDVLSVPGTAYVSFWLPAGTYVSGLLLRPRSRWPWLMLGALLGNLVFDLQRGTPLPVFVLFHVANAAQALAGAWLVQRWVAKRPALTTLREFFGLIACSAVLSTGLGATIGAGTMLHFGLTESFRDAWKGWWGSCAMAITIVAPFALTWLAPPASDRLPSVWRARGWEAALLGLAIVFGSWDLLVRDAGILAPYKSRLLPLLLWAGVRFGVRGATAASLLLSLLMAYFTTRFPVGLQPTELMSGRYVFTLQTFLAISTLVALVPAIALSERDASLARLRDSEDRYRNLVTAAFEGLCISENGKVLDVNDQLARMFGYERAEFLGRSVTDFVSPESRALVIQSITDGIDTAYEHSLVRKDGSTFYAEAQARMVRQDERLLRMTAIRDISHRKQAEEAVRASEGLLRQFIKYAPAAIAMLDTELRYLQASDRWLLDYQLTAMDIIGKPHYEIFPDAPERWREVHQRVLSGAVERCDEDSFLRANGTVEWLQWEVRPWHRPGGAIGGLIFFTQVITKRKQTEERHKALEAQLRQAQKMDAIGTLAGGIAHDFNNILGAIMAHAEIAKLDNPDNAELEENLTGVLQASTRATSLVQQILTFSRRQPQERRSMQLGPVIYEALKLLRSTLPSTIQFRQRMEPGIPPVHANSTHMHQVLINLCTNAGHAMQGGPGQLSIALDTCTVDADTLPSVRLPPGRYVRLTVSDTGHGMSEETLERIFEPFFTTKGQNEGTGLGLAVVHGIVEEHEGAISAESQVGVGTTFRVLLPVAEAPEVAALDAFGAVLDGHGERILVVDDEKSLMETTSKLLRHHNYAPAGFTRASAAWEAFSASPAAFDLIITDLTMPEMVGLELARRMLALRPTLPIVLTTGSLDDSTRELAATLGVAEVLLKPLDYPTLLACVHRLVTRSVN